MKKPKRIIIVRHAESVSNAAGDAHLDIPTYAYGLTEKGEGQALMAGKSLKEMIGEESVLFISSDYLRAKLTLKGILQSFLKHKNVEIKLNPSLREIERAGANKSWGENVTPFYNQEKGGDQGETYAHAYDRLGGFWAGLKADMILGDLPENVVIVTHDKTIRSLMTLIYDAGHQLFEKLKVPNNTHIIPFILNDKGKYESASDYTKELDKHPRTIKAFIDGVDQASHEAQLKKALAI
jgi:broad specificity phosphatase PhoE